MAEPLSEMQQTGRYLSVGVDDVDDFGVKWTSSTPEAINRHASKPLKGTFNMQERYICCGSDQRKML